MKPKIAPTSPKTRQEQREFEQLYAEGLQTIERPRRVSLGLTVTIAFLIGLVGAVAGLAGVTALKRRLPADSWIRLLAPAAEERVIIEREQASAVDAEQEVVERNQAIRPVLVGVYADLPETQADVTALPTPDSFLGSGVVVANTGLVLTTRDVVAEPSTTLSVLLDDRRVLPVTDVTFDPASPFVFLGVSGEDLRAAKFAARDSVVPGGHAYAYGVLGLPDSLNVIETTISALDERVGSGTDALLESSDSLDRVLLTAAAELPPGAALLNVSGEVIGLARGQELGGQQVVVPIWHMRAALRQLLRGVDLIRPSLGVTYLDLGRFPALVGLEGRSGGALLTSADLVVSPPVAPQSAAADAELQTGDIILEANGIAIDRQSPLSEVIQEFTPGEQVALRVERAGEELDVDVTLKILRP